MCVHNNTRRFPSETFRICEKCFACARGYNRRKEDPVTREPGNENCNQMTISVPLARERIECTLGMYQEVPWVMWSWSSVLVTPCLLGCKLHFCFLSFFASLTNGHWPLVPFFLELGSTLNEPHISLSSLFLPSLLLSFFLSSSYFSFSSSIDF